MVRARRAISSSPRGDGHAPVEVAAADGRDLGRGSPRPAAACARRATRSARRGRPRSRGWRRTATSAACSRSRGRRRGCRRRSTTRRTAPVRHAPGEDPDTGPRGRSASARCRGARRARSCPDGAIGRRRSDVRALREDVACRASTTWATMSSSVRPASDAGTSPSRTSGATSSARWRSRSSRFSVSCCRWAASTANAATTSTTTVDHCRERGDAEAHAADETAQAAGAGDGLSRHRPRSGSRHRGPCSMERRPNGSSILRRSRRT